MVLSPKISNQIDEKFFAVVLKLIVGPKSTQKMSLACLVCHGMDSPSHSFRSYSVSSSEGEGRCGAIVSCLTLKQVANNDAHSSNIATSKVAPFPVIATGNHGVEGAPRLQRSHAVSRDLVRDWNFDEIVFAN